MALPMPRLLPVTMAFRPERSALMKSWMLLAASPWSRGGPRDPPTADKPALRPALPNRELLQTHARGRDVDVAPRVSGDVMAAADHARHFDRSGDLHRLA